MTATDLIRVRISAWAALHLALGEGNDPWEWWGDDGSDAREIAAAATVAERLPSGALRLALSRPAAEMLRSVALDAANALDESLVRRDSVRPTADIARLDRQARDAIYRDASRLTHILARFPGPVAEGGAA